MKAQVKIYDESYEVITEGKVKFEIEARLQEDIREAQKGNTSFFIEEDRNICAISPLIMKTSIVDYTIIND